MPLRRHVATGSLLLVAGAACAFIASLVTTSSVDYAADAGPAIHALTRLDFHRFFISEPQMGAFSLLLRWPFAALVRVWNGGQLDEYRLGLFACLFATAAVALVLAREMQRRGRSSAAIGLVLGLWFLNPAALQAVNIGHPEELLGGALCVLAVLMAGRASPVPAGVTLGLALATKQWALVAVAPVLLGARNPLRTAAIALALWLPLELPLVAGNFDAYRRLGHYGVAIGVPSGLWWPFVHVFPATFIESVARPLVVAAAFAVSLLAWRRHAGRDPESRFALLALVLLLRALLDPTANMYFTTPFLMALIAFEAVRSTRLPVISVAAAALIAVSFHAVGVLTWASTPRNAVYLAWALPLAAYLWVSAGAPRSAAELRGRELDLRRIRLGRLL